MSVAVLKANVRTETGKQAAKRLRRDGLVPGIYYLHGEENVAFSTDEKELRKTLQGKSNIFDFQWGGDKTAKCIVREVQWDPVTDRPVHIDLMGVKLTEKVSVEVSIALVGTSVGAKNNGGILQHLMRSLEIESLPLDIPDTIEVDVSDLDIHDSVHVGDIKIDKVQILNDPQQVIVSILPPRVEEEEAAEAEPTEEGAEPEVISQSKKDEEKTEGEDKK